MDPIATLFDSTELACATTAQAPVPASPELLTHPSQTQWRQLMQHIDDLMREKRVHPSRAVVLVPYAQLIHQAQDAWKQHVCEAASGASFTPRFESTMNWATSLNAAQGGFKASTDDLTLDAAVDGLTAANLLERAGLAAEQNALSGRLVEAAWSLSRHAAAQAPTQRLQWGAKLATDIGAGLESPALALELAVARIALVWAAASSYPSDVLFSASAELLVVVDGFQAEPLLEMLKQQFGEKCHAVQLPAASPLGDICLHAAQDAEDEAHRAAACVLAHLAQGRQPVALIAQDRLLTRRVRAMLAERGVVLRDETGWKLSTTRAAATLMSLLRAVVWDVSTDAVLDFLKNAPSFGVPSVTQAEIALRRSGVRFWRAVPRENPEIAALAVQMDALREGMQRARSLVSWLRDCRLALQFAGHWDALVRDSAGAAVIAALRLHDGDELVLPARGRISLADFSHWVNQTLEAASFSPRHPADAQVVILPLSQLLGRPMQAVVLPGCDEVRLAVSPEPPSQWTAPQRELLGLPSRAEVASAHRAAWQNALQTPHIDLLWRQSEGGERLMPSGFVQALLLQGLQPAPDPRSQRMLAAAPTLHPLPVGDDLPVDRLSASAYEDLRRCPYRFFALRQLRLQESDELESELGKRDFGNWLHKLLHSFHLELNKAPATHLRARVAMINIAAEAATAELGLSDSEFLPFAAIWPRVREGYLTWLAEHEASGATFEDGEVAKTMPLGKINLIGKIDRIDTFAGGARMVLDYKTEGRSVTVDRLRDAQEDTQLAFYAALLDDDTLQAAYVNVGEKEATRTYPQPDIVDLRDGLIQSILSDLSRISAGAPMPALGEGKACDYCAARGLCRKDFWSLK